ncbi:Rieske (2Fe-2S) protein [Streptomyces spiralis]|uniref:Rieske (2Fe-2S) protein n=1 Tax=Streptomyces spiralis TaxID=66376 RepID=UPI0033D3EE77
MRNTADRYINRLLAGRRPRAFTPTDDDLARIRAAVELTGSRTEQARPTDAFVDRLRDKLAAELEDEPGRQPKWRLLTSLRRDRRRFLRAGLISATAFAAGLVTKPLLSRGSAAPAAQGDLTPSHGSWQTVATSAKLPEGAVLDFDLGAVTGFVHRTSGHLRAVSGVCTHQACRLTLNDTRDTLACPCHGATFALDGGPLHNFHSHRPLPALPRLAVREHNGQIQVYGPLPTPPPERA